MPTIATKPFKSNVSVPPEISENNEKFSSPILNKIAPYKINGQNKTRFWTELDTNIQPGDRVFILNGNYDSKLLLEENLYTKDSTGYTVLWSDRTSIVLDIDYNELSLPPWIEDDFSDYIKINTTNDIQYEEELNQYFPYKYLNNNVLFNNNDFLISASNLDINVSVDFTDDLFSLQQFNPNNNERILIMNNFTYNNNMFKKGEIYKYEDNTWKLDIRHQKSFISRSNFRNGSFNGKFNDGIFGQLENENEFTAEWESGILINSKFTSIMNSKSDSLNKSSFYSFIENDEIKTITDNSNNRTFGYNFAWRSRFEDCVINNGNILESQIGAEYTESDKYLSKFLLGSTHSFSVEIERARCISSDIEDTISNSGQIEYSNVENSNCTALSLDSSYNYSRVSGENVGGTIDILDYEKYYWNDNLGNTTVGSAASNPDIIIHRFYISKKDWEYISKMKKCFINFHNLVTNQELENEVVNFFDSNFQFSILDYDEYNLDYTVVTKLKPDGSKFFLEDNVVKFSDDSRPCLEIIVKDFDTYIDELEIVSVRNAKLQVGSFCKSQFDNGVWKANKINPTENIIQKTGMNLDIVNGNDYLDISLIKNIERLEENDIVFLDNIYGHEFDIFFIDGTYKVESITNNTLTVDDFGTQNNIDNLFGNLLFKNRFLTYDEINYPFNFQTPHGLDIDNFISIHSERIINSEIRSGFISRVFLRDCEIENKDFKLEKDFTFENVNLLKFNEMILSDINNININSGIFLRSFIFNSVSIILQTEIIWNNGIIHRSIVKNIIFNDGIIKQSKWVDDNSMPSAINNIFKNGKFLEGDKRVISDNSTNEFKWAFLVDHADNLEDIQSEWQTGTFEGGEFFDSIWERGEFKGGKFWKSIWATGTFKGGIFGDNILRNRDTRFTDAIWTDYVINTLNYSFNTKWENGRFIKGRFGIRNPQGKTFNNQLVWEDGIFEDGVIVSYSQEEYPVIWEKGNFNNGLIEGYVHWLSGNFNNGRFISIWGDGFTNDPERYAWKDGVWNGGIFGNVEGYIEVGAGNDIIRNENPSWFNGRFSGGDFYGRVWNNGIFTGGNFLGNPNNYSQNVELREKFDENIGQIELSSKNNFSTNYELNGQLEWRFYDTTGFGFDNSNNFVVDSTFVYSVGNFNKTFVKFKSDYSYLSDKLWTFNSLTPNGSILLPRIESSVLPFNVTKIEIPFVHQYEIDSPSNDFEWQFKYYVEIFKKGAEQIWDNSKILYRGDTNYDFTEFKIMENTYDDSDEAGITEHILSIDLNLENIRDIDNNRVSKIEAGEQIFIRISYIPIITDGSSGPQGGGSLGPLNILRTSDIRLYSDDFSQNAKSPDKFVMNFSGSIDWYGMWRDGQVVIDDASTSDSNLQIELTNKNRSKKQFKDEVSERINFENCLWVNGKWDALGDFKNSVFLDGTFNKGRFIESSFNPYVPRWSFDLPGGSQYLTNGTFEDGEYSWYRNLSYGVDPIFGTDLIAANGWDFVDNKLNFLAYENDSVDAVSNFTHLFNVQKINKGDYEFEIDIDFISGQIGGNNSYVDRVNFVIYDALYLDRLLMGDEPAQDAMSPNITATGIHSWTHSLENDSILAISIGSNFQTEPDNAGDILLTLNSVTVKDFDNYGQYQFNFSDDLKWLGGTLDNSEFNISQFEKGMIRNSKLFGANVKDGVAANAVAENCIWENGVWKNGMWLGSNFERLEIFEEGLFQEEQGLAYIPTPFLDTLIKNSFRLNSNLVYINSLINDDDNYVENLPALDWTTLLTTTEIFTLNNNEFNTLPGLNGKSVSGSDLSGWGELLLEENDNNLFNSIVNNDNYYDNNSFGYRIKTDSSSGFENDIAIMIGPTWSGADNILDNSDGIDAKLGNGAFLKGVWENGVWNNGPRDKNPYNFYGTGTQSTSVTEDGESIYQSDLILDNIINSFESSPDIWQIELSGSDPLGITYFNIGDRIAIGNIIGKTVNNVRKTLNDSYRIIDIDYNQIRLKVEIKVPFPLSTIEKDSIDHKIYVTSRVWENGIFHNGRFEGVWNSGIFQGYPMITLMEDTQFISGRIDGGHFKSNINNIINAEVGPSFSTSLIQNSRILLNNNTGSSTNLSTFDTYLDVNWQDDFGETIDQEYSAIWPISEGTFKITTSDILQSSTNLWLGIHNNNYNQDLNLGTKFTRYTDIINSSLEDIQPPERLEDRGWKFSIRPPSSAAPIPLGQDQEVFTGANYDPEELEYVSASVSNTYQPIFGFENIELNGAHFSVGPQETPVMIFDDIIVNNGNLWNGTEFRPDEDMNCNINIHQNYTVTMEASGTINKTYPTVTDFLTIQSSIYINNSRETSWQTFDNLFEFPDSVSTTHSESLSASISFNNVQFQETDKVEFRMRYIENSLAIYSGSYLLKVEMNNSDSNLEIKRNVITGEPLNLMRINTTNSSDSNAEHNITHQNIIDNVTDKRYWEVSYLVNNDGISDFVFPKPEEEPIDTVDLNVKTAQFATGNTINHYHWNFNRNSQLLSIKNVISGEISDIKFIELDQIPFYKYYDNFNNIDDNIKDPFFSSIEDIDIIDSDNRFVR